MTEDAPSESDPPDADAGGAHAAAASRRRDPVQVVGLVMVVIGATVLVAGLVARAGGGGDEAADADPGDCLPADGAGDAVPAPPPVPDARYAPGRTPLCGFDERAVRITGPDGDTTEFCALAALEQAQWRRGLMEVTDPTLGGYDAMVFLYDEPRAGGFYMRNTPMPLSIAYFDPEGRHVSQADMAPCEDVEGCPNYPADGPFRAAIEVPEGGLDRLGIGPGATLDLGRACPPKG